MKIYKLTIVTLLFTFILTNSLKGQTIDSLVVLPANPTSTDSINVISYTSFNYLSCPVDSSSINISNDTITLYGFYTPSMAAALCNSIDTMAIGILNYGTYILIYHLIDDLLLNTNDIDTITFTVDLSNGLQQATYPDQDIKVYPNPSVSQIRIEIKTSLSYSHVIDIYSIDGKRVKTMKVDENEILIDVGDLPTGFYFIVITDEYNRQLRRKIIKM